jgi:hypothetical protein
VIVDVYAQFATQPALTKAAVLLSIDVLHSALAVARAVPALIFGSMHEVLTYVSHASVQLTGPALHRSPLAMVAVLSQILPSPHTWLLFWAFLPQMQELAFTAPAVVEHAGVVTHL